MAETSKTPAAQPDAGHIPMTEELDSAKWTLPPIVPMLIALAVVGIAVTTVFFAAQPKAGAQAEFIKVGAVPQEEGGNVFVAAQLRIKNLDEKKDLWVRGIEGKLSAGGQEHTDSAASPANFERYFQAFPGLESYRMAPFAVETKVPVNGSHEGLVMFSFPVDQATFDARQNFTVTLDLYDRAPIVISEKSEQK